MKFKGELTKFITQTNFLEIYAFLIEETDTQYVIQYPITIIPRWLTDYRELMDEIISNRMTEFPDFAPVPLAPGFKPKNPEQTRSVAYIPKAGYIMVPMYEFAEEDSDINKGGREIRQGFIDSIAGYYMLDIDKDPDEEVKAELDALAEEQEKNQEESNSSEESSDIVQKD